MRPAVVREQRNAMEITLFWTKSPELDHFPDEKPIMQHTINFNPLVIVCNTISINGLDGRRVPKVVSPFFNSKMPSTNMTPAVG